MNGKEAKISGSLYTGRLLGVPLHHQLWKNSPLATPYRVLADMGSNKVVRTSLQL